MVPEITTFAPITASPVEASLTLPFIVPCWEKELNEARIQQMEISNDRTIAIIISSKGQSLILPYAYALVTKLLRRFQILSGILTRIRRVR